VCATLAQKLGVESPRLDAPAIARSAESRSELAALPGIEDTLAEGAACDVAVVGIGGILPTSTLVEAGYFTLDEFLALRDRGVVGDVCCHFLDATGSPRLPGFSERIIGLSLEQLRNIPKSFGIATGAEKAAGVAAVLRGGYVKGIVCDEGLARALLETTEPEGDDHYEDL
jgi:DNA-binding transcriptional regulator LsrR (DeoR family)